MGCSQSAAAPSPPSKATEAAATGPPPPSSSTKTTATGEVDFDAVRRDILAVMNDEHWDDGSYAPVLIRLAWHASGTYDKDNADIPGGSRDSTMRYAPESTDPENAGLDIARIVLEPIQAKHPGLSSADLWVLAAYCALEVTGGPIIPFSKGRADSTEDKAVVPPNGRLPGAEFGCEPGVDAEGRANGWEKLTAHVRSVFNRMGFNDREIVALLCGGHVYGRCHPDLTGYAGPWVEAMTKFSNEYAADMIEDKWMRVSCDSLMPDGKAVPEDVRPREGKTQYVDLSAYEDGNPNQMMLVSDMILLWDPLFNAHLKDFAKEDGGEEKLKQEFGIAYKKLTELGCVGLSLCPAMNRS